MIGQRFGRLTVISQVSSIPVGKRKTLLRAFLCRCECGSEKTVIGIYLRRGLTKSCGCLKRDYDARVSKSHGLTGTPAYKMLCNAKTNAKARGVPFDLDISDIVIPEFCPALGIKLSFESGRLNPNRATIDRMDNSKGYVKGNVAIISWRANMLKRDASPDEVEKIATWLRRALQQASEVE